MKKTLLTLMLASMLAMTARGQVLQNTWWRSYDTLNVLNGYWHFGQDTLYGGQDTTVYFVRAVYTTSSNLFTIRDVIASPCFGLDTGKYNFTIILDSLRFISISDLCNAREYYLTNYYFVRFYTGIETTTPISSATISPNPSATGIFNLKFNENGTMLTKIYVMNVDGKKIMEENYLSATTNHTINLQSCASGIYFLVMENEKGRRIYKLVR